MAVPDQPQQQPPTPTNQRVKRLIDAAAAGKAAKAATTEPGVVVSLPAQAAVGAISVPVEAFAHGVKTYVILRVLRRLLKRTHTDSADWLTQELRRLYPDADPAVIRAAVERELKFEEAFQQKSLKRVEADLHKAGGLPTPEAQQKRVNEILAREKHYAELREKAMLARAKAHVENAGVKAISPKGAKWVLGTRKNHTLGCLALAGKNWPWEVLDQIPPPIHSNCGCTLKPLGPDDTVIPVGQALAMAKAAMALEEALREVTPAAEIDLYLAARAMAEAHGESLEEVNWKDWLHPRGRGGEWIDKLGGLGPPKEPHVPKPKEPEPPKEHPKGPTLFDMGGVGEKPKAPKPDYMPKLSPESTVVSGAAPKEETVIGGTEPEPAKQGPIPSFGHIPLSLQLPPAFGADHIKAKSGGQTYIVKDHGGDRAQVANELLANSIYRELGVDVPTMGHVKMAPEPDFTQRAEDLPNEPPIDAAPGARISTGIILREPDGRMTLIEPRNHYGGYIHTFPKGGVESNLTPQQNAHKELWEETGLHAHITGVVGDFKGDTGVSRYYVGVRTGGEATPSDETEAIKTVTPDEAAQMLNKQRDQDVLKALLEQPIPTGSHEDSFPPDVQGSALAFQGVDGKTQDLNEPSEPLGRGYMADALLANRDVVGQRGGSIRWRHDGTPVRTSMNRTFGAGSSGQHDFGSTPEEAWTMRSRGQTAGLIPQSEDELRQQAADIARILTNAKIDQLAKAAPYPDPQERKRIAKALKARVAWMRKFADGTESLPKPASGADARAQFADAQGDFDIYPEERQALADYAGDAGRTLDGRLQSGKNFTDEDRRTAKALDGVLEASKAPVDSYVYMGAPGAPNESMVGKTFSMKQYIRGHTEMGNAKGQMRMRILVPGGARALHLEDAEPGQPDMLLPRDQRVHVTGLRPGPDGVPQLDAMVLPYRDPQRIPSEYKSPMSQTSIKGYKPPKLPKGEFFAKGDRVAVNGNKATVTGDAGKGMANVKLDSGKGYTVPFSILKRLEEAESVADFKEWLHPRGRGGKWILGQHEPKSTATAAIRSLTSTSAPPIHESLARIEALGIDVLPPGKKSKFTAQDISDIADVFEEAFKQYPILSHGPGAPVRRVEFTSAGHGKLKPGVLADTGIRPASKKQGGWTIPTGKNISQLRFNDSYGYQMKPAGPPTPGAAVGGGLSPASQSWAGVTWHELGHAMMNAIDMAGHHDAKRYVDWMARYGVSFEDCKGVSTYAVASRSEGIAELSAMENMPGFSGLLGPELEGKVHQMFEDLRNWDVSKPYVYQKPLVANPKPTPAPSMPKIKSKAPSFAMPPPAKLAEIEAAVKANPGEAGVKMPVAEMDLKPGDVFEGGTPGFRYLVIADPSEKNGLRYVPLNQGKKDAFRFSSTSKRRKVNLHFELQEGQVLDISPEAQAKAAQAAAENLAAGDWVADDPFLDQNDPPPPAVQESVYTEALHPRGRGGKWIGKGGVRAPKIALPKTPVDTVIESLRGKEGDEGYQALARGEAIDTQHIHQVDGKYTEARQLLHQHIIDHFFANAKPAKGKARAIFTAGGAASGKSTLAGQSSHAEANLEIPDGAVYINPDDIKEMLPEYNQLKQMGREDVAAAATHEESSDLAKLLTGLAMQGNYPIVVDGTGNSKVGKFGGKLRAAADRGYDVTARYAHVPVSEAITREQARAKRTGRKVAESLLREQHRTVAQSYVQDVAKDPRVHVEVYSTVERGKPKLIAEKAPGKDVQVHDQKQYSEHLGKAEA